MATVLLALNLLLSDFAIVRHYLSSLSFNCSLSAWPVCLSGVLLYCPSICLAVDLSSGRSICLSIYLSVCRSIHLSICRHVCCPSPSDAGACTHIKQGSAGWEPYTPSAIKPSTKSSCRGAFAICRRSRSFLVIGRASEHSSKSSKSARDSATCCASRMPPE